MLENAIDYIRSMLAEIDNLNDKAVKLQSELKSYQRKSMPGLGQIKMVLIRKYDISKSSTIAIVDAQDNFSADAVINECVLRAVPDYIRIGQDAATVLMRVYDFMERTGKQCQFISVKKKEAVCFGDDAKVMMMVCGTKADYYLIHDWSQVEDTRADFGIDTVVGAGFGKGKMYGKVIAWMEEIL